MAPPNTEDRNTHTEGDDPAEENSAEIPVAEIEGQPDALEDPAVLPEAPQAMHADPMDVADFVEAIFDNPTGENLWDRRQALRDRLYLFEEEREALREEIDRQQASGLPEPEIQVIPGQTNWTWSQLTAHQQLEQYTLASLRYDRIVEMAARHRQARNEATVELSSAFRQGSLTEQSLFHRVRELLLLERTQMVEQIGMIRVMRRRDIDRELILDTLERLESIELEWANDPLWARRL